MLDDALASEVLSPVRSDEEAAIDAALDRLVGEIARRNARGEVVRMTDGARTLGYYVPGRSDMVTEAEAAAWLAGREIGRREGLSAA